MAQQTTVALSSYRALMEAIHRELQLLRLQQRAAIVAMIGASRKRCAQRLLAKRQNIRTLQRVREEHWRKSFEGCAGKVINSIVEDMLNQVLGTAAARELLKEAPIARIISSRLAACEVAYSLEFGRAPATLEWHNKHFSARYSAVDHARAMLSSTSVTCSIDGSDLQINTHKTA
jgi:hypothetical protein